MAASAVSTNVLVVSSTAFTVWALIDSTADTKLSANFSTDTTNPSAVLSVGVTMGTGFSSQLSFGTTTVVS